MGHRADCQQSFSNEGIFYAQPAEIRIHFLVALVPPLCSRHDKAFQRRWRTESDGENHAQA